MSEESKGRRGWEPTGKRRGGDRLDPRSIRPVDPWISLGATVPSCWLPVAAVVASIFRRFSVRPSTLVFFLRTKRARADFLFTRVRLFSLRREIPRSFWLLATRPRVQLVKRRRNGWIESDACSVHCPLFLIVRKNLQEFSRHWNIERRRRVFRFWRSESWKRVSVGHIRDQRKYFFGSHFPRGDSFVIYLWIVVHDEELRLRWYALGNFGCKVHFNRTIDSFPFCYFSIETINVSSKFDYCRIW